MGRGKEKAEGWAFGFPDGYPEDIRPRRGALIAKLGTSEYIRQAQTLQYNRA
jgi:hypothetical protein